MKKFFSIFGMLTMISSVVLAGGTNDPWNSSSTTMAIVKTQDGVKVFYKNDDVSKVKVTIYDESNNPIFSEEVKSKSGFARPYNLTNLPKGDYRIVMQDNNEMREKNVSNVSENERPLAGIIKANKNQFAVTLYSKAQSDLKVTVLDNEQNVLFTEKYSVDGRASKLFNIRNISGAVSVEVADDTGLINAASIK